MALRADVSRQDDWFVGETKRLLFTVWTDKTKATRADITGWTFSYDFYAASEVAFTLTTGEGVEVSNGPQGEVTVIVAGASTEALDSLDDLHHVLRRTDAGNEAVVSVGDVILNDPAEV